MTTKMNLNVLAGRYEQKLGQRLQECAENIADKARNRVYRNLKTPKAFSALAEGIRVAPDPDGGLRVIADKPYARFVEFGTSRQPPRPFLTPAVEEAKAGIDDFKG